MAQLGAQDPYKIKAAGSSPATGTADEWNGNHSRPITLEIRSSTLRSAIYDPEHCDGAHASFIRNAIAGSNPASGIYFQKGYDYETKTFTKAIFTV